jgi:hypothetical protein
MALFLKLVEGCRWGIRACSGNDGVASIDQGELVEPNGNVWDQMFVEDAQELEDYSNGTENHMS